MQKMQKNQELEDMGSAIAIVGMSGRFPGANNIKEFWKNLKNGEESIQFFSDEELENSFLEDPNARKDEKVNTQYVKARGILEDVELFDANFFSINPTEAEVMDPQHRIFLECAVHALEDASCVPETYKGIISVYASSYHNMYLLNNLYSNVDLLQTLGSDVIMYHNSHDHLATLLSYKLNLTGASVTVQTACSSSLVAVHLACQSLLTGESDLALAGGVCISVPQKTGYHYQAGGILSSDGHCRSFGAESSGTVFSNAVGIVALKRLEDAAREGDHIYAIIKGSAINNDGSVKAGFMAPSVEGQARVIMEAMSVANVEPNSLDYIETHGTATILGDELEIAALDEVFKKSQLTSLDSKNRIHCALGSVKSNIGHASAASGVVGLIKTALALKHKQLPKSLHCETLNPKIKWDETPFYVNTSLKSWEKRFSNSKSWQEGGQARRAGVSSFGVGGTNAHVILEETPPSLTVTGCGTETRSQDKNASNTRAWQIFALSARTELGLKGYAVDMAAEFMRNDEITLPDLTYTLLTGRNHYEYRVASVVQSGVDPDDFNKKITSDDRVKLGQTFADLTIDETLEKCAIVFMFPGQGSQYARMAQGLYQQEPAFGAIVDECIRLLLKRTGVDLSLLFSFEDATLQNTSIAQPALFIIEYSLAKFLHQLGIKSEYSIGHSIGEYVAACLADVFSLEDALYIVARRGALMQAQKAGSMLVVKLPEPELIQILPQELSIAAINGPDFCVVSGETNAIQKFQQGLSQTEVQSRVLKTSHGFHSAMMD